MVRWSLIAVALPAAVVNTGCGYSTERPFRRDIQSVHVEMFDSKEFRRELEFKLTESLAKRIEMDTPYRIATRERADSVLSGEIVRVDQRTLGTDFETDRPRELASTVVVNWRWKNLKTGEIQDMPRQVYTTSYIPPVGESFDTATVRGLDGLAEQIVASMESGW